MSSVVFPDTFRFGIADADLQVIGERHTRQHEQSLPTMWAETAASCGSVYHNDTPLDGIDRYNRWEEDAALLAELGVKHYRTSVSMSRILKEDKSVNEKAIGW